MAAINDDVYKRIQEKVQQHDLDEKEVKAIETARDQLRTHTSTGGMVGAATAFFLGKRRKFNPIQMLALTGGGFLMGSQMGLISGALAGVKTINTLPNPQRLVNVIREAQLEAAKGNMPSGPPGSGNSSSAAPGMRKVATPMSQHELHQAQSPQDQFAPDINENISGERSDAWGSRQSSLSSLSSNNNNEINAANNQDSFSQPQQQQAPQANAWDKIRAESLPNNSWSKIRQQSQQNPDDAVEIAKSKAARARRLQESSTDFGTVEELPRTREETRERGTSRRNQWGDSLQ